MAICFVDTETTGLKAGEAEIIEIALIRVSGWKREVFTSKVRMERPEKANAKALEINGYNEADWADAPAFADIAGKIETLLSGATVIAHNVKFDVGMICADFSTKVGREIEITNTVDTIDLCKSFLKPLGLANNKLDPYTGHTEQVFDALYDMDLIVSALSEAGREQRAAEVVEAAVALAKKAAPYGQDLRNLAQCVVGRLGTTGGVAPVWVTFL